MKDIRCALSLCNTSTNTINSTKLLICVEVGFNKVYSIEAGYIVLDSLINHMKEFLR